MPKYVLKEDVEKGLVDPTKPLKDQPAYQQKIQKEQKARQAQLAERKQENPPLQQNDEGRYPDKKQSRKRQYVDKKYYIRRKDITLETPVPDAPKNLLPKLDKEKFHNNLNQLKEKRQALNKKRADLRVQLKERTRNSNQNKGVNTQVKSKYSTVLSEKHNTKEVIEKEAEVIEAKRSEVQKRIKELKGKLAVLQNPKELQQFCKQDLEEKKKALETRMTTANIDKKEQARIHAEIGKISRILIHAKPEIQIEAELSKLYDQLKLESAELDSINNDFKQKSGEARVLRKQISKIMQEKNQEASQIPPTENVKELREKFQQKIQQVENQAGKLTDQIEQSKAKHFKALDEYEQQQDLLYYIKIIKDRQEQIRQQQTEREKRKKENQEKEKKWQMEKEEREKKKQAEIEEWEKKKEEKRKELQQRKRQQEQKKQQLQKQRQAYINGNPHQNLIDMCNFLISYCERLKPQNKVERTEQKPQAILEKDEIKGKGWEKQLNRGAQVIVSKKAQQDQGAPQKSKKQKPKREKDPKDTQFSHALDTYNRFERLNLIAPTQLDDVDNTIKEIQDRISIYMKPSEEELQAYRQRAGTQFDQIHGFNVEPAKKVNYKEKGAGQVRQDKEKSAREEKEGEEDRDQHDSKKHKPATKKQELKDSDFPDLTS